jgi:hypothetical protein
VSCFSSPCDLVVAGAGKRSFSPSASWRFESDPTQPIVLRLLLQHVQSAIHSLWIIMDSVKTYLTGGRSLSVPISVEARRWRTSVASLLSCDSLALLIVIIA